MRLHLLRDNQRLTTLLKAVGELSGGWKRGPFVAEDGSKRARGVAMASPFGTQTAVIAEVSIENGQVKVHDIWQAIDPGSIVNPAIVEAQVNGAVSLGLSQVLLEEDPTLDAAGNQREQGLMVDGWRQCTGSLEVWYGPGNHFSLLKAPNVLSLAAWWRDGVVVGERVS